MRTPVLVVVVLLAGCGGTSPEASCAGPAVSLSSAAVAAGGEVRVQSGGLWSDCYDTGQPGTPPPAEDVVVRLEPEGPAVAIDLAKVDADAEGRIDVMVEIPEDAPLGPAAVVIWGAAATVEVTAP